MEQLKAKVQPSLVAVVDGIEYRIMVVEKRPLPGITVIGDEDTACIIASRHAPLGEILDAIREMRPACSPLSRRVPLLGRVD